MTSDDDNGETRRLNAPPIEHTPESGSNEHSLAGIFAACIVMLLAIIATAALSAAKNEVLATFVSILGLALFIATIAATWSTICRGLGSAIGFAFAILLITVVTAVVLGFIVTFGFYEITSGTPKVSMQ